MPCLVCLQGAAVKAPWARAAMPLPCCLLRYSEATPFAASPAAPPSRVPWTVPARRGAGVGCWPCSLLNHAAEHFRAEMMHAT